MRNFWKTYGEGLMVWGLSILGCLLMWIGVGMIVAAVVR